jgi:hypothetical protein
MFNNANIRQGKGNLRSLVKSFELLLYDSMVAGEKMNRLMTLKISAFFSWGFEQSS